VSVPRTAPVLCDGVVVPPLELSLQRGCHSGGGGGITCRSPKSVEKNILRVSYENTYDACGRRHTEWKYQDHFHIK